VLPLCLCLEPIPGVDQYAHTTWTVREGFFKGVVFSIAQTPDAYLWLGTEFGLVRFDGVRNVPWRPPAGQSLPSSDIRSLRAARDGRLWIGTFAGLASWYDRKLTRYPELPSDQYCFGEWVHSMFVDFQGANFGSEARCEASHASASLAVRKTHDSRKYCSANTTNMRDISNSASVQATMAQVTREDLFNGSWSVLQIGQTSVRNW
jgi:Two component regulator propeller